MGLHRWFLCAAKARAGKANVCMLAATPLPLYVVSTP